MNDFDINKIGKKMPYQSPKESFFEDFTEDIISKVEGRKHRSFSLSRLLVPAIAVAASLLVGLFIVFDNNSSVETGYLLSDNIDETIDSYLEELSDEDLEFLFNASSYHDDFYASLPNN